MKKYKIFVLCFNFLILNLFSSSNTLLHESLAYPAYKINVKQLNVLELILNKTLAPIDKYLSQDDYNKVLNYMCLKDGSFWPIPINLEIEKKDLEIFQKSKKITLQDEESNPIAILEIEEIYSPDVSKELSLKIKDSFFKEIYYVGGNLKKIQISKHFDFEDMRLTPQELNAQFKNQNVLGINISNYLTKFFIESSSQLADSIKSSKILIHPSFEKEKNQHIIHRCFIYLRNYFPNNQLTVSILPITLPSSKRSLLLKAIIDKNLGCTHYAVQNLEDYKTLNNFKKELKIIPLLLNDHCYIKKDNVDKNIEDYIKIDQNLKILIKNNQIPSWYTYPKILEYLKTIYSKKEGICIYFIGLSGSGKSTIANALKEKLLELDDSNRDITILDGDVIRKYLSQGLGFLKKDRSINVRRIGYTASLIVKNGGICICANIAPYEQDRQANRDLISQNGKYIEVFVNTPLEECEKRDVKGLYKAAKEGKIKNFTGISDPFEKPENATLEIDGSQSIESSLQKILSHLKKDNIL